MENKPIEQLPSEKEVLSEVKEHLPSQGRKSKRQPFWSWLKHQLTPDFSGGAIVSNLLTIIVTALVVLPVFILLHRVTPIWGWPYNLDRFLLFVILFLFFFFLLKKIRKFVWILLGVIFTSLLISSLTGHYSFENIFWDYRGLVSNLANDSKSLHDIGSEAVFPRRQTIVNAIEFTAPEIMDFSHEAVKKNFQKYQEGKEKQYVQCIAVWKAINDEWIYIKDPTDREYIAKATVSLKRLSGDCDDYSILMAACLKSIGASVRLVRTANHIYPELGFESKADLDNVIYLIRNKLFKKDAKNKTIHYHTDSNGKLWLNMDYTAPYPGGKFLDENTTAVLEL